jgi:hypothetical protein
MADAGPDGLESAPPGVDRDAGSANTIAATVEAAKTIGMAHVLEISQDTLAAGDSVGDLLPLPGKEFSDTTELQGEPGEPGEPGTGGGAFGGDAGS